MYKDTIANSKEQMRKGVMELCAMLIIGRGKSLYVSDIIRSLREHDIIVVEGTVYAMLNRLRREGLLAYEWKESKNGPPRKYYSLTPNGKVALKELTAHWKVLSVSISSLLKRYA